MNDDQRQGAFLGCDQDAYIHSSPPGERSCGAVTNDRCERARAHFMPHAAKRPQTHTTASVLEARAPQDQFPTSRRVCP